MIDENALIVRHSPTARRISLRLDSRGEHFVLTLPRGVSTNAGLDFANKQKDWMASALDALPKRRPFCHNGEIPLLGIPHRIHHDPAKPARVRALGNEATGYVLSVGGPEAGLEIRLMNWLRKHARAELTTRATQMASRLDVTYSKISVGDPKSRWGSCSSRRALAFSWRLVLVPAEVMDYVVAHEVAHLLEMNHSPAFWKVVARLVPDYHRQRRWLKAHSAEIGRYGPVKTAAAKAPPLSLMQRLFGR